MNNNNTKPIIGPDYMVEEFLARFPNSGEKELKKLNEEYEEESEEDSKENE